MIRKKILIATGGTGGHIFPAYALANYLKAKNYFNKNPSEKELPIVFIILKLYQYIIILVGLIFGYVFSKKLKENQNNEPSWRSN